tara:strand:+ start:162 stop:479 length:318 start_codon:yes stop_codon:yes gene_type:complete
MAWVKWVDGEVEGNVIYDTQGLGDNWREVKERKIGTSEDQITEIVEEDGVLYRQSVDKVLDYRQKRIKEYPHWRTQLDMLYKDQVNGTTTWQDKITEIKDAYPKE